MVHCYGFNDSGNGKSGGRDIAGITIVGSNYREVGFEHFLRRDDCFFSVLAPELSLCWTGFDYI